MDQNLLLTVERLTLNPDIQRGWVANEVFVIKNVPAQTYLTVSLPQAEVLQAFAEGSTVPAAFARLLQSRGCPPLREFYELVVKACDAGILGGSSLRKPVRPPLNWPALRADFVLWPAAALAAGAFGWLAVRPPYLPGAWGPAVSGLAVALGMMSAGQMLAASLLKGAGGEVYPGWRPAGWPLKFDLRDSRLLRPREQALIALAGNLPLTAALLVALGRFPQAALPVAAAWLLGWRPWGAGLPRRLAGLWSRYPHLDTDTRFRFSPNQRPQRHWREWWRRWDWRVCAVELGWAAGWTLLVGRVMLGELGLSFREVATDWGYWSVSLPALAAVMMITVMVTMVHRWRDGVRQGWRSLKQSGATIWRHWRKEYVFPETEAGLLRLTAAHPLLGLLNLYDQTSIIRAWRPATYRAWSLLASGEAESGQVGMILSGRAAAARVDQNGRRLKALQLVEGDFFGLPQLRPDGSEGWLQARSRTPLCAFLLPAEVFARVVVAKLGADTVYDLTHKYAFLRRLRVCAYWHAHAVARFARLAQIASYGDDEHVIHEKGEAGWFYIVYDGLAEVRSRGKLITRLRAGDFFGEISLLQNSSSTADVVAKGRLRCLQIDRASFRRFMTHNHHVALRLEKISSRRLGYPIFPLRPGAFALDGT